MNYDWEALRRENVLLKAQLHVLEHRLEEQRAGKTLEPPLPEGLFLQEIIGLYARLPERFTVEDLIEACEESQLDVLRGYRYLEALVDLGLIEEAFAKTRFTAR